MADSVQFVKFIFETNCVIYDTKMVIGILNEKLEIEIKLKCVIYYYLYLFLYLKIKYAPKFKIIIYNSYALQGSNNINYNTIVAALMFRTKIF